MIMGPADERRCFESLRGDASLRVLDDALLEVLVAERAVGSDRYGWNDRTGEELTWEEDLDGMKGYQRDLKS
jgi:hypothetical protein